MSLETGCKPGVHNVRQSTRRENMMQMTKQVRDTRINRVRVSTVKDLGHNILGGYKYETMCFKADKNGEVIDWSDIACYRTNDHAKAMRNHESAVKIAERLGPSGFDKEPGYLDAGGSPGEAFSSLLKTIANKGE